MKNLIRWLVIFEVLYSIAILNDILVIYELMHRRHFTLNIYIGCADILLASLILFALLTRKTWTVIPVYVETFALIGGNLLIYSGYSILNQLNIPFLCGQLASQLLVIFVLNKKDMKDYFLSQRDGKR